MKLYTLFLEVECVLHSAERSEKKAVPFSEETLQKCRSILKVRQDCNLKYKDFTLPESADQCSSGIFKGFHMECYKRFVGLSKAQKRKLEEGNSTSSPTLRSEVGMSKPNPITGVFEKKCLFCDKARKKHNQVDQPLVTCEMESFKQSLQQNAILKEDNIMLARISTIDPAAKEVSYHSICRKHNQNEANTTLLAKNVI